MPEEAIMVLVRLLSLVFGLSLFAANAWAQELTQRGFAVVAPPSGDRWEGMRSFRVADPEGRQVAVFYAYPD